MIHCPHFANCSGCTLDEEALLPPVYKEAKSYFEQEFNLNLKLESDKLIHWRLKAKLAVRGNVEHPLIGLYKRGTHEVMPINSCKVHHPLINEAQKQIKEAMVDLKIEPYDEISAKGDLRYLQIVVNRQLQKVQLSLIATNEKQAFKLASLLYKSKEVLWHSIWININQSQDNRIMGPSWKLAFGQRDFKEKILGQDVYFSPASFSQAGLDLFEKIVQEIDDFIKPGCHVAEFYAGVGSIGLKIAQKSLSLKANEVVEEAKEMFEKACGNNCQFFVGDASNFLSFINEAKYIIVDPPRKGLDKKLIEALNKVGSSKTLIYVSCSFESFQRDAQELVKEGWSVVQAKAYLLFPGTNHIETLAFFEKN
jgi:23S rRNA (uracil1939-C5)-methyltransferase